MSSGRRKVCVVGAGVIGLSTAIQIQEAMPDVTVTVIGNKFLRDTTSDGAAGIFRPSYEGMPGVPRDLARQWSIDSWKHFDKLVKSTESVEAGLSIISGYQFFTGEIEEFLPKDIVYHCRECTQKDLDTFAGHGHTRGYAFTTILIECRWYLPWLFKRFKKNGGIVIERTLQSFKEIAGIYEVIVNCSGLASKWLAPDDKVYPSRGQILRVKAPWIQHFVYNGLFNSYIIPCRDNVVVGGTRYENDTNLQESAEDTKLILDRAYPFLPSLKDATIDRIWVGLRPSRNPIRVDKEVKDFGGVKQKMVHNYGHGGIGVASSWGSSTYATKLVLELMNSPKL